MPRSRNLLTYDPEFRLLYEEALRQAHAACPQAFGQPACFENDAARLRFDVYALKRAYETAIVPPRTNSNKRRTLGEAEASRWQPAYHASDADRPHLLEIANLALRCEWLIRPTLDGRWQLWCQLRALNPLLKDYAPVAIEAEAQRTLLRLQSGDKPPLPETFTPKQTRDIEALFEQRLRDMGPNPEPAPPEEAYPPVASSSQSTKEEILAERRRLFGIGGQPSPPTIDNGAAPDDTPDASTNDAKPNPLKE